MRHVLLSTVVGIEAWQAWNITIRYDSGWLARTATSQIEKPFVYRALLPILSQTLEHLFPYFGTSLFWLEVLFVLSAVGFYFSMKYLSDYFADKPLLPFLACQALFLLTFYYVKAYDYATAMFFALSLGLLARRKHGVFVVVFALGCLNRETMLLLVPFYAVWFWTRDTSKSHYFFVLALVVIYVACTVFLRVLYDGNAGSAVWFGETFSAYLSHWYIFLPLVLLTFVRFRAPDFIKTFLVIVLPVQVVLHLLFGWPWEFRVFAESLPALTLLSTSRSEARVLYLCKRFLRRPAQAQPTEHSRPRSVDT